MKTFIWRGRERDWSEPVEPWDRNHAPDPRMRVEDRKRAFVLNVKCPTCTAARLEPCLPWDGSYHYRRVIVSRIDRKPKTVAAKVAKTVIEQIISEVPPREPRKWTKRGLLIRDKQKEYEALSPCERKLALDRALQKIASFERGANLSTSDWDRCERRRQRIVSAHSGLISDEKWDDIAAKAKTFSERNVK